MADIYKQASKTGLRIQTSRGDLSVEQLWHLSVEELDPIAVALDTAYEESGSKSFLKVRSVKSRKLKLQRDIMVDVLETKVAEAEKASKTKEVKEHNQKILALIQRKKEGAMEEMSVEELEKMLQTEE